MRTVERVAQKISKLKPALAVALALWWAGAGCVMVSYAHTRSLSDASATTPSAARAVSDEASGSMGSHHCCKARHVTQQRAASSTNHASASGYLAKREELDEAPNSSNAMSCCPLTSGTFVVNGPQRLINETASMLQDVVGTHVVSSIGAVPLAIPLRLPNQNQTYLRGCVFLI
jgi:hypothetical protein